METGLLQVGDLLALDLPPGPELLRVTYVDEQPAGPSFEMEELEGVDSLQPKQADFIHAPLHRVNCFWVTAPPGAWREAGFVRAGKTPVAQRPEGARRQLRTTWATLAERYRQKRGG